MSIWRSRRSLRREIDEEFDAHIAFAAEDYERAGDMPAHAQLAAQRAFGDRRSIRDVCLAQRPNLRAMFIAAVALVGLAIVSSAIHNHVKWARVSPFTAVQRDGHQVRVRVPDRGEYELLEIDGVPVAEILEHCFDTFAVMCDKRFAEDLVEVLAAMGHKATEAVDLRLRDPNTGVELVVNDQPMTTENRRGIWKSHYRGPRCLPDCL